MTSAEPSTWQALYVLVLIKHYLGAYSMPGREEESEDQPSHCPNLHSNPSSSNQVGHEYHQAGMADLKHMKAFQWVWSPVLAKVVRIMLPRAVTWTLTVKSQKRRGSLIFPGKKKDEG